VQVSRHAPRLLLAAVALGMAASVLAARTEPPRPPAPGVDGAAPPTLTGTVLNASPALALPKRLAVVGDYLVVIDAASDSALHVLDRHTGRLVRSLGRRGKGPGEFHGAWSLAQDLRSDGAVWVYDLPLRRLTRVPLAAEADVRTSARRMLLLRDGAVLTGPEWIAPDTILSLGFLLDARVALFDSTGHRTGAIGRPPFSPEAGEPMQAAQALLAARPDHRRYAIANRYVSRIELLDPAHGTMQDVAGPVSVNTGPATVDLDRFAYVDVAATATRVVALFSGRNRAEYEGDAGFGNVLHVFDWEGRFIGAYRLDADVLAIAADEAGDDVYALRLDPEPAVVRYRLPTAGPVTTVAAAGPAIRSPER
jgi:hypothetical protein